MNIKEPVSFYTHFAGLIASVIGLIFLVTGNVTDPYKMTSIAAYGASAAALFLASSLYHAFKKHEDGNSLLRKFDHLAICVMIAGTYTPFIYEYLSGYWRWSILIVQWVLVLAGFVLTFFFIHAPRSLHTGFYIAMGWVAIIPVHKLWSSMPKAIFILLMTGGIAYTAGAVIYALKKPNPLPQVFGFHEIFHIFILAGAGLHYAAVFLLAASISIIY